MHIKRRFSITKKYSVIYADPPWRYERSKVQGAAEKHYPTMGIDELCALPVPELAAKDCALFLWATFPQLPEALRLICAWGFQYRTVAFVWLKRNRKSPSWFYGILDAQQRGNLSAGDQGQTQAAVGGRTSASYQPHRAAQQKAGCSAGKNRCPYGGFAPD